MQGKSLHFGEYMQSAEKDGKYFTRFVFVTPKTEIEGKDKATFTAHYNGNDYTFETPKSTAAETQKSASTTTKATEAELNTDGENVFPDDGLNWSPLVPVDRHETKELRGRKMKVSIYSREAIEHGYSDLRIEQILSRSHRNLSRYIASGMRR